MRRLRDGSDQEAWSEFVELYSPLVERRGRRLGGNSEAAQGAVQDTFVRLVHTLPGFEYDPARGRFRGYVLQVARSEIGMARRRESARMRANEAFAQSLDPSPEDESWWAQEEERRALELALRALREQVPARRYELFRLAVLEGVPHEELATRFGVTRGYVAVNRHRLTRRIVELARRRLGDVDGR